MTKRRHSGAVFSLLLCALGFGALSCGGGDDGGDGASTDENENAQSGQSSDDGAAGDGATSGDADDDDGDSDADEASNSDEGADEGSTARDYCTPSERTALRTMTTGDANLGTVALAGDQAVVVDYDGVDFDGPSGLRVIALDGSSDTLIWVSEPDTEIRGVYVVGDQIYFFLFDTSGDRTIRSLYSIPVAGGDARYLAPGDDFTWYDPQFVSADDEHVYVNDNDGSAEYLFQTTLADGTNKSVTSWNSKSVVFEGTDGNFYLVGIGRNASGVGRITPPDIEIELLSEAICETQRVALIDDGVLCNNDLSGTIQLFEFATGEPRVVSQTRDAFGVQVKVRMIVDADGFYAMGLPALGIGHAPVVRYSTDGFDSHEAACIKLPLSYAVQGDNLVYLEDFTYYHVKLR